MLPDFFRCRLHPAGVLALGIAALFAAAPAAAAEQVVVLGLFRERAVLSIDGTQRVLRAGETSPEGVRLIAADSDAAILEIDGRSASYALGAHILGEFAPPQAGRRVLVAPDPQGMYRVNGSINGFQAEFMVDTGATLVTMNRAQAERIGIDYRLDGTPAEAATASGIDRVHLVRLERVRVGEIELDDVAAAVHGGDHPLVILLGNSFLNRIDLRREGRLLELREKSP